MTENPPPNDELMFEVTGKLGKSIRTTRNYWQKIVENKHPKIEGKVPEVKKTIKEPDQIRRSKTDPDVYLYYRTHNDYYFLSVVVKHLNGEGFVVTTYITDTIKEGETVWEK